ncbi:hypothetical protein GGR50DRAFT_684756 [Xylaria sp. CBS 124048]|nr:hypothetical protein GGR50DRAFT_684756 [Xylaria sp. CBS 124048]
MLRRTWTRIPHAPRWPAILGRQASFHVHSFSKMPRAQSLYCRAALPSTTPQTKEKPRHLARSYSNYAPRDPYQYHYNNHNRQIKSRLKDMAIGSILTIVTYIAFVAYSSWDSMIEEEETEQFEREWDEICQRIRPHIIEAEAKAAEGDLESAERSRELFISMIKELFDLNLRYVEEDYEPVRNFPLFKFPEWHALHGREQIEDGLTAVFVAPIHTTKETQKTVNKGRRRRHFINVAVYHNVGNMSTPPHDVGETAGHSKLDEIIWRVDCMISTMYDDGVLDRDVVTEALVYLPDYVMAFAHEDGKMYLISAPDDSYVNS